MYLMSTDFCTSKVATKRGCFLTDFQRFCGRIEFVVINVVCHKVKKKAEIEWTNRSQCLLMY